jgi:hypothetical protein
MVEKQETGLKVSVIDYIYYGATWLGKGLTN